MAKSAETRILDNIVRHMQNEEEDPLTPLIEEYLIKRKLPKYAKKRLRSIELDLDERPRPGGRLSPSSLCGCERQAAFKFLGVEGQLRTDPDVELIFEDGHWRHHKWQTMFLEMERILGRHRFRVLHIEHPVVMDDPFFVAGSLDIEVKINVDGHWQRYVIDFKGANNWSWEKAYRSREPDPTYVKQLMTYMKGRKCKRGMLLFDSKDKNKFYVFTYKFKDDTWAEVSLWCRRVIEQVGDRKVPPMHPGCQQGVFMYNKCPYRKICFSKKTEKQIRREVYLDFPGVKKLWDRGHAEIEAHRGFDSD